MRRFGKIFALSAGDRHSPQNASDKTPDFPVRCAPRCCVGSKIVAVWLRSLQVSPGFEILNAIESRWGAD